MDKLDIVDAQTVCVLLDITDRTLRTWVNDLGCPSIKDGRSRTFQWPAVRDWWAGYVSAKRNGVTADFATDTDDSSQDGEENLTQANLRKTRAEADLKQLILAQKRGQVIGIADAKAILDRMLGNLKSQLLGAGPLLNTRLESEGDAASREAAIRDFMENLCRELATGKIVREAVPETEPAIDETGDAQGDTVATLAASAEDVTDDELNAVVIEYLAAHAALEEVERVALPA